jgi:hypothetical protein
VGVNKITHQQLCSKHVKLFSISVIMSLRSVTCEKSLSNSFCSKKQSYSNKVQGRGGDHSQLPFNRIISFVQNTFNVGNWICVCLEHLRCWLNALNRRPTTTRFIFNPLNITITTTHSMYPWKQMPRMSFPSISN